MRSGDFVPFLSRPTSPAEKKQLAAVADRSIAAELQKARAVAQPDLQAVYADEAGNLLAIRRALEGNPRTESPGLAKLSRDVEGLLNQIVDARISGLRLLAAAPGGPDAIRQGESEAFSLKADLQRLHRFGFTPRTVDVDALDLAVKQAVVNTTGRRGGWSPP
jgi:hypothetical protein